MKKKLLILLLALSLTLTACGKAKEVSAAEKNAMNSFVKMLNNSSGGEFFADFEEDSRTLRLSIEDDSEINNSDSFRTAIVDTSKNLQEEVGDNYTVSLVFSGNKAKPLVSAKNGKIEKDILDETAKKQSKDSEKQAKDKTKPTEAPVNSEPLTDKQKMLMDAYIEGGNSSDTAKSGLVTVEFDDSTRTYYVLYSDDAIISDGAAVRKAAIDTTSQISEHIGDEITVKVAYKSKKYNPLLILKDGKIIEDNLS